MPKQRLRVKTRLVILSVLLAALGSEIGRASYSTYYDDFYACDSSYSSTLDDCRSNPSYPSGPTESQCRFYAGDSYTNCLNSISSPLPQPNFCREARIAADNCMWLYSPPGGPDDPDAYFACIAASGVDQCQ